MITNPNQALIDEVNALETKVQAVLPRDPNISVAIGGLHTCRDNLKWHGESTLERQAKEAAAKAEVSGQKSEVSKTKTAPAAQ